MWVASRLAIKQSLQHTAELACIHSPIGSFQGQVSDQLSIHVGFVFVSGVACSAVPGPQAVAMFNSALTCLTGPTAVRGEALRGIVRRLLRHAAVQAKAKARFTS